MTYNIKSASSVLIVDDHAFVRKSIETILFRLGVKNIHCAENGVQARKILAAPCNKIDLILCDLSMPLEDGFVLIRALSQAGEYTPIFFMTSGEEELLEAADQVARSHQIPVVGSLKKPLTFDALKSVLEQTTQYSVSSNPERKFRKVEILEALREDRVEMHFQPQIDLQTGRLHGVEALVRLRYEDGLVYPDHFIPTAEKSNLIADLTEIILFKSLQAMEPILKSNVSFKMSINLSQSGLDINFPENAQTICKIFDVNPSDICFELTETAISNNKAQLLEVLARLRMNKFKLSIDDFGTGFSSLAQLKGLPFHELKIDKSFVMDALSNKKSYSILKNSLRLARDLNLKSVAEGVESDSHYDLLKELGCTLAQGYFISKPLHPQDFFQWAKDYLNPSILNSDLLFKR